MNLLFFVDLKINLNPTVNIQLNRLPKCYRLRKRLTNSIKKYIDKVMIIIE